MANLNRPVLFHQAMRTLIRGSGEANPGYGEPIAEIDMVVEVGRHSQLESFIKESFSGCISVPINLARLATRKD